MAERQAVWGTQSLGALRHEGAAPWSSARCLKKSPSLTGGKTTQGIDLKGQGGPTGLGGGVRQGPGGAICLDRRA